MSEQLEPELERVARMLADAGPLPDAPASLRARALGIPEGDAGHPAPANVVPIAARRARRRPRTAVLASVAAVVAAAVIVPTAIVLHGGDGRPKNVALDARPFAPKGSGKVSVAQHGDGTATIAMVVWGLPNQGSGMTYEAWLGRDGDRRALGTFRTNASGTANISFKLPKGELGSYRWVWVTSEPAGGSATPSKHTALWGSLT